ncbi:MAG TPA: hypothetical protein VGK73_02630 [Polyangiaceae bacterium]
MVELDREWCAREVEPAKQEANGVAALLAFELLAFSVGNNPTQNRVAESLALSLGQTVGEFGQRVAHGHSLRLALLAVIALAITRGMRLW